jgi:hypothetical protein
MTSTAIRINEKDAGKNFARPQQKSGSGRDRENLASLVKAARGADPVRHVGSRALRAGAELRKFQHAVVRPAHALAALRRFSFWNAHKIQFNSLVLVYPAPPRQTIVLWSDRRRWVF